MELIKKEIVLGGCDLIRLGLKKDCSLLKEKIWSVRDSSGLQDADCHVVERTYAWAHVTRTWQQAPADS